MNIISPDVEMNKYERLGTKTKRLVNALELLGMPYVLRFFNPICPGVFLFDYAPSGGHIVSLPPLCKS